MNLISIVKRGQESRETTQSNPGPVEAVVCVVDRSGSMGQFDFPPTRLGAAMQAVIALMDAKHAIDIRDRVALVAFNIQSQTVANFQTHRSDALIRMQSLRADGSTNIHDGLALALDLLGAETKSHLDIVQRIVLLSDGAHNTGSHPEQLLPRLRSQKVIVDTVAIGTSAGGEYDEALLRRLAKESGGEFTLVRDVETLIQKYRKLAAKKRMMPAVGSFRRIA
jgi:Ca-activated chloride channel family protein